MTKEILASNVIQESMKEIAQACRADWATLGKAHVLLTGGTGFFGSWIIVSFAALRQAGFPIELTVLSRDPDSFLEKNPSFKNIPGLTFRKGDVVDATIPFSVTHVFHFATSGSAEGSDAEIHRTVVEGTRHMLSEGKRVGGGIRFLFASSGAVYGKNYGDTPVETTLHDDAKLTAYGRAKREAEKLCRDASIARDLETVIVRGFTFCGPLFPVEGPYVVSSFMSSVLYGTSMQVRTPGAVRTFLDGRDLVTVLWKLLARGRNGEAYNVGSDESVTMGDLADLMRAVAVKIARRVPEVRLPGGQATGSAAFGASDIYRPSIQRLATEFGWKPTIPLRQSLRDQAQWAIETGR